MLHVGAGVNTLSYTDIGMNALCYIYYIYIGTGVKTLSNTDIGVNAYVTYRGRGINLILH